MALNMLKTTCLLLTLMINSPVTTSIKVLSIARKVLPIMIGTSLSSSMVDAQITKGFT